MKDPRTELYDRLMERNFRSHFDLSLPLDRRSFLKLGGGVLVLIAMPGTAAGQPGSRRGLPEDFNAFLLVGEDGQVTGFTGKIEMGQGINTSLAQMLAEELNVPLERVRMVMGDTDLCPWDMGTFGSLTTRAFGPPFRKAAAEARAVLVQLAAERLQAPAERLQVIDGEVIDPGTGRRVTYGELTQGQRIVRRVEGEVTPESPAEFNIVGRPVTRQDAVAKVTGAAQYAGDIRLPGMLYARILRPPAHGARLIEVDASEAERIEGVRVIRDGDLVAVLHSKPDVAEQALAAIKARFEPAPAGPDDESIYDHLLQHAPAGEVVAQGGDLASGQAAAILSAEETYLNAYVAHAPIEPHTALAAEEGGRLVIWASTQTPFRLKEEAAAALQLSPDQVRVITPFVGGGFGGKSNNLQALEAARLAKLTGRPVQVAWSRAEEFFLDTFRPAAVVKIKAGTDRLGNLTYWDYAVYGAGERGSQQFYAIPNHRTVVYGSGWRGREGGHPFATGPWRAPANNTNTFARECHIDILAHRAGLDPVSFRLRNLKDPKLIGVLRAAADRFGWEGKVSPSGRGIGVAMGVDAGTSVAHLAEVEVDRATGRVRVKRVVCAQNMGLCVNPEGAALQMEGCITMGLGYALAEQIRFKDGAIRDNNFDTYKLPRFSWLPEIETVIIEDRDSPPQGGGEPAIVCMGAVLANAIFDAVGARLFRLPMTPERVKGAMAAS